MAYQTTTLGQFISRIGSLLDDTGAVYWPNLQVRFAVWEALRVWGAYTNYWRARGSFPLNPANPNPFYDLSVLLPGLRTRSWTLLQMVQDIQLSLLEPSSGLTGAGMSGQVTIESILTCIQQARNRFVQDARFPLSVHTGFGDPPPPDGMIPFDQSTVFLHKASWQDRASSRWTNLWRSDEWGTDKADPTWNLQPGSPDRYSEAANSPLRLQIIPPPANSGVIEALTVDSLQIDTTDTTTTFNIPDEWIHAVKYAALSQILSSEGQIKDPLRAQYCEERYQQAVTLAKSARSVMRLMCDNVPLPIDSLMSLDSSKPYWRNQTGRPESAGVLYDLIAVNPGLPNSFYGIAADVVQSAPIPIQDADFMPIGEEEMDSLTNYVTHSLTFKCGGKEFQSTLSDYDSFMSSVGDRGRINAAKIRYLTPLLGQPQKEWQQRPDRMEVNA